MDEKSLHKLEPFWNSWYIDGVIGEGSYGSVYRIVREEFGQKYFSALKIISTPKNQNELKQVMMEGMTEEEAKEYFKEKAEEIYGEINLMTKLKGKSSIVSYEDHQVVERKGNEIGYDILIRMELLKGLNDYVVRSDMDVAETVRMGREICHGLVLCQKHGIMHRDIKPDNIFVSGDGEFKLGDFGIARKMESLEHGFTIRGTYEYMAPEVYHGEKYDSRVDIYSLGIVLYMFLNKKKTPFIPTDKAKADHATRQMALKRRFSGEKIEPPVQAGAKLSLVILKAIAYEPEDRYQTAEEFYDALMGLTEADCLEYVGTPEEKKKHMDAILAGEVDTPASKAADASDTKDSKADDGSASKAAVDSGSQDGNEDSKKENGNKEAKEAATENKNTEQKDKVKKTESKDTHKSGVPGNQPADSKKEDSGTQTKEKAETQNHPMQKETAQKPSAQKQVADADNESQLDASQEEENSAGTEFKELDRTVRLSPRETLMGNRQETQVPEVDELASLRTIPQQSTKSRTIVIAVVGVLAMAMIIAIVLLQSSGGQGDSDPLSGDAVASIQTEEPEETLLPSLEPEETEEPAEPEETAGSAESSGSEETAAEDQEKETDQEQEPAETPVPQPVEDFPSANSKGLEDITELEGYEYATALNLMNNEISQLEPLKDCIYLENLNASHNKITDVSALKKLETMKVLDLGSNVIKDISDLKGLKELTVLKLSNNAITDISAMEALENLEEVDLSYNTKLKDISPLLKLKRLKNVYLLGNDKINKRQLKKLETIIEKNGGMLLVE